MVLSLFFVVNLMVIVSLCIETLLLPFSCLISDGPGVEIFHYFDSTVQSKMNACQQFIVTKCETVAWCKQHALYILP